VRLGHRCTAAGAASGFIRQPVEDRASWKRSNMGFSQCRLAWRSVMKGRPPGCCVIGNPSRDRMQCYRPMVQAAGGTGASESNDRVALFARTHTMEHACPARQAWHLARSRALRVGAFPAWKLPCAVSARFGVSLKSASPLLSDESATARPRPAEARAEPSAASDAPAFVGDDPMKSPRLSSRVAVRLLSGFQRVEQAGPVPRAG
jgi:hypothetical protein